MDYLRGLAAFGIMIFHYLSWTLGKYQADAFMGRIGIYGVSIFYVLSGLTLFHVYHEKMLPSKEEVVVFFKKRIFRIYPLLWLVTILAIILSAKMPDFFDLFLNLSGLFGFIRWDTYFAGGVWSIGNELVFYVLFPFFILFSKSYKFLMIVLSLLLFSCFLYFAFFKLDPEFTLDDQKRDYLNPLNQAFLFLCGYLIGIFTNKIKIGNAACFLMLVCGFVLFVFYPAHGNTIVLVTGINRLVFTFCCLLICLSFYKISFQLPAFIHKPLSFLGEISYSVYLLHFILYEVSGRFLKALNAEYGLFYSETIRLIVSFVLTLVAAYFVYEYYEKYFIKKAHKKKDPELYKLV